MFGLVKKKKPQAVLCGHLDDLDESVAVPICEADVAPPVRLPDLVLAGGRVQDEQVLFKMHLYV